MKVLNGGKPVADDWKAGTPIRWWGVAVFVISAFLVGWGLCDIGCELYNLIW